MIHLMHNNITIRATNSCAVNIIEHEQQSTYFTICTPGSSTMKCHMIKVCLCWPGAVKYVRP